MGRRSHGGLLPGFLLAALGCGGFTPAPPGAIAPSGSPPVDAAAEPDAGLPTVACPPVAGLKMIAPISGTTLATAAPELRVQPAGVASVDLQICRDRACAQVAWQRTIAGSQVTGPELPPGYWFWRTRETGSGDSAWSAAWQFRIRAPKPGDGLAKASAVELFRDMNDDGYPDAILYGPVDATVCQGGPGGLSADRVSQVPGGAASARLVPVGDLDGDGAGELAWLTGEGGWIVRGCSGGPALEPALRLPCSDCLSGTVTSGDVNGDGLWDVVYGDGQIAVVLGAPVTTGSALGVTALGPGTLPLLMDLNDDGFSDLYTSQATTWPQVFWGGAGGLSSAGGNADLPSGIDGFGDFDGDGHLDLVSWTVGNVRYGGVPSYDGGPLFPPTAHSGAFPRAQAGAVVDLDADGYDDLVLLVPGMGVVFLAGSPAGLAVTPVIVPLP